MALAEKERPLSDLLDVVRRVIAGDSPIDPGERRRLLELSHLQLGTLEARRAAFLELTGREQDVLARLVDGQSAATIAWESSVSLSTVRSQIRSILLKLGVHSQLRAVSLARQAEWTGKRVRWPLNPGSVNRL